jgi:hypothetical protein
MTAVADHHISFAADTRQIRRQATKEPCDAIDARSSHKETLLRLHAWPFADLTCVLQTQSMRPHALIVTSLVWHKDSTF